MTFFDLRIRNAADLLLRGFSDDADIALLEVDGKHQRQISIGEIDQQSAAIAGWLRAQDIGSGDAVLILQPLSLQLYISLLAVIRIGAIAVFADPHNLRSTVRAACQELKPLAVIGTSTTLRRQSKNPHLRKVPAKLRTNGWGLRGTSWRRALQSEVAATETLSLEEPAIVSFVPGPTGQPVGVVRTHGQILEQHGAMSAVLAPLKTSIVATDVPSVGLSNLALGIPTVMLRRQDAASLAALAQVSVVQQPKPSLDTPFEGTLDRHKRDRYISRMVVSPGLAGQLVESADDAVFGLDDLIVTGPIYPDIAQKLDQQLEGGSLRIVYGHPEVEPIAELAYADTIAADRLATSVGRGVLVGKPIPEVQVAILPDDYGMPMGPFSQAEFRAYQLEVGEVGEVLVTGDHMVTNYVNGRAESETKVFVDGRIWHRTGDAGTLDPQGRLWLLGRCLARMEDELGTTYPLAVEAAARCQLGLRKLACVDHDGRSLLVIESAASLELDSLQEVIGMTGISGIVVVDRLPMERHQDAKVDYRRLMQMLSTRSDLVRMDFDDAGS
ncbi:MAG: AMP-binding protein [Alphaproteobacteria bacterium]|nr:AMP-binding protein [Alphaproteobacteria bacterium SS10]